MSQCNDKVLWRMYIHDVCNHCVKVIKVWDIGCLLTCYVTVHVTE